MEWITINTACFAASNAISKTSPALRGFIREVRESRAELDAVLAELSSLDGVLDILKDDATGFPAGLASRTPSLLDHCTKVVNQIEGYMHVCNGLGLSKREKKFRWMAIRADLEKLKSTLEGYKIALGLASDLVGITKSRRESDKESVHSGDEQFEDAVERQITKCDDTRQELSRVMTDMGGLRARLHGDLKSNYAVPGLERYLKALQIYATNMGFKLEAEEPDDYHTASISSAGDAPDSAIDMNDEPPFRNSKEMSLSPRAVNLPIVEIDEFLDELKDLPEPRPPTPPPKAVGRSNSMLGSSPMPPHGTRPASVRSVSDYGSAMVTIGSDGQPSVPRRVSSLRSLVAQGSEAGLSAPSMSAYSAAPRDSVDSCAPPPIRDSRVPRLFSSRRSSFTLPARQARPPGRPGTSCSIVTTTPARVPVILASPKAGSLEVPKKSIDTAGPPRPSTSLSTERSSIRSVRRLSNAFRKVSHWSPKIVEKPVAEDAEPDTVFGVSLKKSIQIAGSTAKTHHSGSSGSSKREFPRCILMCTSFIKDVGGIEAPNIFGEPGDLVRVAALKDAFSAPPSYGDNVDWDEFDVYDAADLIVLFLQQLPKPLISETVAKRWVSLSKQATMSGSLAFRADVCIDFWDEALLGIRGPARSLFKLLLNLWGDIADAADRNDMTAERLAGRLLNALMHLPASKYGTDYMLGLAFLIRKRSEYSIMLRDGRKSKAAFEA